MTTTKPKRKPHRPNQSVVSAGVGPDLHERARSVAHDHDTTVSDLVRGSLSATVARLELEAGIPAGDDDRGRKEPS
jgi:hypothetical protein